MNEYEYNVRRILKAKWVVTILQPSLTLFRCVCLLNCMSWYIITDISRCGCCLHFWGYKWDFHTSGYPLLNSALPTHMLKIAASSKKNPWRWKKSLKPVFLLKSWALATAKKLKKMIVWNSNWVIGNVKFETTRIKYQIIISFLIILLIIIANRWQDP